MHSAMRFISPLQNTCQPLSLHVKAEDATGTERQQVFTLSIPLTI